MENTLSSDENLQLLMDHIKGGSAKKEYKYRKIVPQKEFEELLEKIPPGDVFASGDFFNRFGFGNLIREGNYFEALDLGEEILHEIRRLNEKKYKEIHLGTPFYWMGMAAYLLHEYQSAIYYIDASRSEDIKNDFEIKKHSFSAFSST